MRAKREEANLLLADDHKLMREGLRLLLQNQPGLRIVGEADNGRAAVQLCRKLLPDVVIMDIAMPDLNGIEATRQIVADCPGVKIIGLSVHSDRQFVKEMLKAGARGYLLKECAFQEVLEAIRAALAGKIYLSPAIASQVVEGYLQVSSSPEAVSSLPLTPREREVLQLLAEGRSRREIAKLLHVSPRTIETHRRQIMDKTKIKSNAELVKLAIREGLTALDS